MLGAIIGDLAAWTYEHDRKAFWHHLVSEEAKASEFGMSILATTDMLQHDSLSHNEAAQFTRHFYRAFNPNVAELSNDALEWRCSLNIYGSSSAFGICLLRMATCSFFDKPYNEFLFETNSGNDERYALFFLCKLTSALRTGKTKDEAFSDVANIYKKNELAKFASTEGGMLNYFFKAWNAFYAAFDYTSAIHNAMRMKGNRQLLGALTGAIAGAMYGCRYALIKEKYNKDEHTPFRYIPWPTALKDAYMPLMRVLEKEQNGNRFFYPKNNAMTNVERHTWKPVKNVFEDKVIGEKTREAIFYAFDPDWDNRFGFYWENGWFYVYRSGFLLSRFQLKQVSDGTYRIYNLQNTPKEGGGNIALREALYSIHIPQ